MYATRTRFSLKNEPWDYVVNGLRLYFVNHVMYYGVPSTSINNGVSVHVLFVDENIYYVHKS